MTAAPSPTALHPQLSALEIELAEATARAQRLAARVDEQTFARRPGEGSWSAAECIAHLNLTSKAYLPLVDAGLAGVDRRDPRPGARYRKDLVGSLLAWILEPPVRMKVKTSAPFVPGGTTSRAELLREFEQLQRELSRRIAAANDYDLARIRIKSPFGPIRHNLLSTFAILTAHERRHLCQAERAAAAS